MSDTCTRSVPFELRSSDGKTLAGYAAVFNSPTRINERGQTFDETIAPGAFARTINAKDRVVMQFEHGQHPFFGSLPLGRIDLLREDDHGLYVETSLNDSWMIEPVRDAIANGAVTGMSFRFSVPDGGDTWDRSGSVAQRTINEVRLYELGPVVHPAYEDTTVGVRSALNLLDDKQRAALLRDIRPARKVSKRDLNGWTLGDLMPLLADAAEDQFGAKGPYYDCDCYVLDVSDTWFVYSDWSSGESQAMKTDYTVTAEGAVTLSTPVEVIAKVTYLPDPDSTSDGAPGAGSFDSTTIGSSTDTSPMQMNASPPRSLSQRKALRVLALS